MKDIASFYDYYIYQNLIRSLLMKRPDKVRRFADGTATMVLWGPSIFVGGEFSPKAGEELVAMLDGFDSPHFLWLPDDKWRSFIKDTFPDRAKDRTLNVYQFCGEDFTGCYEDDAHIVQVTQSFINRNLPGIEQLLDELYSYTDTEDFLKNGFGFALVIDDRVCGYCLSEYTIAGSHGVNIWLDEKYRGQGYARKMVSAFLSLCRERKQTAYWACDDDNIKSNRLAQSAGFVLDASAKYFEL